MASSKNNKFQNIKIEEGKKSITIKIITGEHIVIGKLFLPIPSTVENPTIENLLFYVLNCGNMFISLHDCTITDRNSLEFTPEHVDLYNINLNIVQSCQIVKEETK